MHKLKFIEQHVPPDVQLILIGHSIGCYMILNMLDALPEGKVVRSFMLMPTIERMALSPNGQTMTPILRYLRWLIVFCALILSLLPKRIRSKLVNWHYRDNDFPPCVHRGILDTLNPWSANYATFLGKVEMNTVTDLQRHLVKKHSQKLSFYYGSTDHWAPVKYYYEFKADFPDIDVRICTQNIRHAFVMDRKEGQEMARIVWQWIETHNSLESAISTNGHSKTS